MKWAERVVAWCGVLGILSRAAIALAAPPATAPVAGLRDKTPAVYAITGARVIVSPDRAVDNATLVIRKGVVVSVIAGGPVPRDARVLPLPGKTIYPGLIDAFTELPADASGGKAPAGYWNDQVRPERSAARQFEPDETWNKKLRSQGITARLAAPAGGVIKGTSVLATTADVPAAQAIVRPLAALHVRLGIPMRPRREEYPGSPMGAVALARQAMYDSQWYAAAWQAARNDPALPRPEVDESLAALGKLREEGTLVIFDALNELYALRADRFAREFGLKAALRGSGREYRRLEAIRATGRAVIVPVAFPEAPYVATPESVVNVGLDDLLHWDIAPENPARLEKAGITIALTTYGLKGPDKFLDAVRTAVERGLPRAAALRAMTVAPAQLLAADDRLGTLEPGRAASFFVTDGDLFERKSRVLETWVEGRRYDVAEQTQTDLRGTWDVTLQGENAEPVVLALRLGNQSEKLQGGVRLLKPEAKEKETKLDRAELFGLQFGGAFDGEAVGRKGVVLLSGVVTLTGETPTSWQGHVVWPDGARESLSAVRTAAYDPANDPDRDDDKGGKAGDKEKKPKVKIDRAASFPVNYPLGDFGRVAPPEQPRQVLLKNATVWTCNEPGIIEKCSVHVGEGRILAVGPDLVVEEGVPVVDLAGKHLTPGIIDCHSHMASDGGINEATQAITAEVRIGDFVNCDDISIYRQLAGGVTAANILHGSANPIGGHNQVLKLRWGAGPEEMKMAEAPPGIKFALGENVKQSNWGEKFTTRYPQTRMGVEQIMRDALTAAREYQNAWDQWRADAQGPPPRRDLELDALAEILAGKRWIHCHSYRQDEIIELLDTLEEFGVTIGTLQHILEGYKVADRMARHGAMGSAFSDWWAYKFEVYDAIPYNGAMMFRQGVVVSFNSDDQELARHLNLEAAKAVKYGGVPPAEALKFVTLNPAMQLRIDGHVGSITPGKQADLAVWSASPLSTASVCEQTWVDGRKYFDRQEDQALRQKQHAMRTALVQKILASGDPMRKPGEPLEDEAGHWPDEDMFCPRHGH